MNVDVNKKVLNRKLRKRRQHDKNVENEPVSKEPNMDKSSDEADNNVEDISMQTTARFVI
jgi:hypothetical protein